MKFKIGNIEINNRVLVAPMAGITNYSFRSILKDMGAGLIYTEMISDKALIYNNEKTFDMIKLGHDEHPIALQLFGSDEKTMGEATKIILEKSKPDIIDINMGCPVNKVVKTGAGSKLMSNPKKAFDIVQSVVENSTVPVTVKMRIGWDKNSINAVEFAKILENAGASAIAVHGRTRSQLYSGKADWEQIKLVKENVSIPVFGNGDIFSAEDALEKLNYSGVDAVMLARGVQGNPWLVEQTVSLIEKGIKIPLPTFEKKIDLAIKHLENLRMLKGDKLAMLEMRTHAAWYVKGMKNASIIKQEIINKESASDMYNYLLLVRNDI